MINKLKADRISAMKEKNTVKKTVLGTLVGEIELLNKTKIQSNSDIIKTIKKMIDNNIACDNIEENEYLETYLPKSLSDNELENIIQTYISTENLSGMKSMGKIMGFLNTKYPNQFNGKTVASISKKYL
jgi:uncharacterized protein YqeY